MRFPNTVLIPALVLFSLVVPACEAPHEVAEGAQPTSAAESLDCDGYDLDESWEPDSCNVCVCTVDGPVCTTEGCEDADPMALHSPVPDCDGRKLGEMWMPDTCNWCMCTAEGIICTTMWCELSVGR
jgi:hypothetical protein